MWRIYLIFASRKARREMKVVPGFIYIPPADFFKTAPQKWTSTEGIGHDNIFSHSQYTLLSKKLKLSQPHPETEFLD